VERVVAVVPIGTIAFTSRDWYSKVPDFYARVAQLISQPDQPTIARPALAKPAARILAAAGEVFLEKGFAQATTLQIAARARVSKRDLYRHFASKQGVLEALIATHSSAMAIQPDLGDPHDLDDLLASLAAFGPAFLTRYLDPRKIALYRMAIAEAPRSTDLGRTLETAGAGPVIASFQAFAAKAISRGILAADDAELVMSTYFDVLVGPWHLRLLTGTHPPPDRTAIELQGRRAVDVVRRLITAGRADADRP